MNEKIRIMRDEKISSALLKFGVPSIVGFLITAVYNFVDALFVGKLGTNAMGAASVVFPIAMIMIGIGLLFGSGAASYISRFLGKGEIKEASRIALIAILGSIVLGVIIIVLLLVFLIPVLKFLGATENILPYAKDYGYIFIIGSIFNILNLVLNHIARSEGAAKASMVSLIVGAVLNIGLDPLFIYTFNWGIKGAAIATLVSQVVSTILLLIFFNGKTSVIELSIKNINFSKKILFEMIKIGIPYCIAQLLAGLSMGLINSSAAPYGDAAVAAVGIANRIFAIGTYIIIGFSKGFQPIAGYNYGAKKYDRLKESISIAIKWATCVCVVLAILQIVFSKIIVSVFTNEIKVLDIGIRTLRAYSLVFPLFGFQVICMELFLTLGKAKEGFLLSLGRQGIFLIPTILILPKILGLNGVIFSQPIADLLTVLLTVLVSIKLKKILKYNFKVAAEINV
ncbi:MAG: MATE family efflux transporter [Fusobacteriaceae bacterium]|nr:MATE family efflux transporter [Fusobacteriaceae bacterium]